MPRQEVTDEMRSDAVRLALAGVARSRDANELVAELAPLHPKGNTFPAEVLLELAADALEAGGVTRREPLDYAGLFERFLPECGFRGRSQNERRHYALRAAAMICGGIRPDLLDDTYWWGDVEDLWIYALYALVICVRAAADRRGETPEAVVASIAARRDVTVDKDA